MTGKDEPPFKDWRNRITSMGPDWRSFPSAWWGRDDWAIAEARYQPLNETLPAPAPTRVLPAGFRLSPVSVHPRRRVSAQCGRSGPKRSAPFLMRRRKSCCRGAGIRLGTGLDTRQSSGRPPSARATHDGEQVGGPRLAKREGHPLV